MNWDAVGAVGESLSAVAVLITLVYLTIQVRQNNRSMRTSALRSVQDVVLLTEKNDRYIACLMKSARNELLTEEDRALMVERFLTIMRTFERIWKEHKLGAVTREQFEQHLDLLRWAMSVPEARRMWSYLERTFDPGFRAMVDAEALAEDAPISSLTKAFLALDNRAHARDLGQ